jgi:hypothetical protein
MAFCLQTFLSFNRDILEVWSERSHGNATRIKQIGKFGFEMTNTDGPTLVENEIQFAFAKG